MSFTVSANSTQYSAFKLETDFSGPGISGDTEVTINTSGAITAGHFSYSDGEYAFTGTFTSSTLATGTYAFTSYPIIYGIPYPPYIAYYYLTQSGTWNASFSAPPQIQKDDFLGTWDGQGVYFRNSESGNWVKLSTPAEMIAAGYLDDDDKADLIGIWPGQGGVWVRYSKTGAWSKLSSTAKHIAAGDMNGDMREDLLGTWDGQGVFYRDSISGSWIKLASPATLITTGDLDDDGIDDLIGIWPTQGGVWVKYSQTGAWAKLSNSARDMATGDMNGDGRDDLVGTWDGQGVYYRDSVTGLWTKISTPAEQVTAGDLDGDGTADLIGLWASQGGVWVKYSKTGTWSKLSLPAKDMATGLMRGAVWGSDKFGFIKLLGPFGGLAEGPGALPGFLDKSPQGPGGWRFAAQEDKNLVPQKTVDALVIPGPGEPGFRCAVQKNLVPQEATETKRARGNDQKPRRK